MLSWSDNSAMWQVCEGEKGTQKWYSATRYIFARLDGKDTPAANMAVNQKAIG
jgi:hypothetical protein